ncbi:MAG: tyrosine-type recombinase/integrase, partial [Paracoccaceae bacterium]
IDASTRDVRKLKLPQTRFSLVKTLLRRRLRRRPEPQGRIRWLTPAEAARLLAAMDARTRLQSEFLLGTGCRTGEAFALDRTDLHIETRQAMVRVSKNGDERMTSFPTRTARALAAYGLPADGAVFRTPKGKPYTARQAGGGQMQAAFNAARDAADLGPDVTPHVLRHTWATWHYAQNKDLLLLKTLGGWKTTDIALRYAKLAPANLGDMLLSGGWDFRADTNVTQEDLIKTPNRLISR